MKILIISPTSSGIGGIAGVVQNQVKFLKKKGHEVDVISSENTFTIPIKGLKNPSFMISSFLKTKFQKKYDIVHAHNPASAIAMKNISGKKILSLWGVFETQIEMLHGSTLGKLSGKFEKNILKNADIITVASKDIQKFYAKLGHETHYVPNAIDIESLPKEEKRLYENQIIFVGRLSKEKGILDLLKISANLPKQINLLIVGSGPEEEKVKKISDAFSNIHYLGYQARENVIPLIRGSDILIQPSLMEGGINSTLLEAMVCKTPILISMLEAYGEEIKHLKTAYCIKSNSSNDILAGIIELVQNKQLRNQITGNAYDIVKNYSWENICNQYIALYEKALHTN